MNLTTKIRNRILRSIGWTNKQLDALINEDRNVLHNPLLYHNMEALIDRLHQFKLEQDIDRNKLLIVDPDYDTDGLMCAAVLSAALDIFNIDYRVYIPSMSDGYGLSVKAVDDMLNQFGRVDLILTADNGTNAVSGVKYAKQLGIPILVTDHHLGDSVLAEADIIVNPNKGIEETYPFRGNAGAAVAWKTMMAYAMKYQPDTLDLIYDLIVFAGIANVSDVMPIIDENHFMVKEAVKELNRLIDIRKSNNLLPYEEVKSTPYPHYNTVFHALYDIIDLRQTDSDLKRLEQGKKSIPLPNDEELISWYLSPMMNAPRRVEATSNVAMRSLLSISENERKAYIERMIAMNQKKSELRDKVLNAVNKTHYGKYSNVLFVNTKHGISGLIAGRLAELTGKATIVFAKSSDSDKIIYQMGDIQPCIIGGSARSNHLQPLNVIMGLVAKHEGIIVGGGGHAAAAGYSINSDRLDEFKELFDTYAGKVYTELVAEAENAEPMTSNTVTFLLNHKQKDEISTAYYTIGDDFGHQVLDYLEFQNSLKPFGKDFEVQPKLVLQLNPAVLKQSAFKLNQSFWKTLKFELFGVEVLTWNIELANRLKELISSDDFNLLNLSIRSIKINDYSGKPQIELE